VELTPEAVFETGEGLPLEPSCLGSGAELELYGKWLEISRRLQARQLIVHPGAPISLQPAPADSLAYLIVDLPPEELKKLAAPDPRSYPVAGGFTQLVVALRPDQTLQPLFRLTPELKLFPLPIGAGEPVHFLVQIDLPRCERHWLGRYEPAQGLSGQWFTPQFRMQWVWQADRAAPLFFKRSQDRQSYQIYEAGQVTTFHQPGFSDAPIWFMGWHMPTRQVIPVRFQLGKDNVALLNPGSGQISLVGQPPFHALQRHGLSPDGNWLAYPAGMPNLSKPPTRFELLNLANGSETDLLQLEVDEELRSFAWSPYLSQPLLVILTGSLDGHTPPSSRLLLVRPDRPGQAFELASDIALAEPVFCSDGSLLYRAGQEARYQLLKQHPGRPAETLLTLDHPFKLLACP
jgi:hypothetical protein